MKLYIYDHCPFCARARMMVGLRQLSVTEEILLNDDEDTPIRLIGAKQVPILEKPDGLAMGESLDIVHFLDELANKERLDETVRAAIQMWFDKVNGYYSHLTSPRMIHLGLPEFATQTAIDYFVQKKEKTLGSFAQNMDKTKSYLNKINRDLIDLEPLVLNNNALNGESISLEDILIFPILRNLTMVRGVEFPPNVTAYIQQMATASKIALYFDRAL